MAAFVVLGALLVYDAVRIQDTRILLRMVRATRLVDVAASIDRVRAINPVIAIAGREAGGSGATLELPDGYSSLLAVEPDYFVGKATPTVNMDLMGAFLGGRVREVAFGPVLSAADAAAIESDPKAIALPMNVWALPGDANSPVVRMYTDPARLHVYVVPSGRFRGEAK